MHTRGTIRASAIYLAFAIAFGASPLASADPSEQGAVASNGKSIYNPGFEASGEAKNKVIMVIRGKSQQGVPNIEASKIVGASANGIAYHNGRILNDSNGVTVNIIWYGTWSATQKSIITNLVTGLNNSPYYNINTTYYDSTKKSVVNKVNLGIQIDDKYSLGASNLSDQNIWTIVTSAISKNSAINNPQAITLVLTSADVSVSGFLTSFCGWHNYNTYSSNSPVQYSFVGNPGTNPSCATQTTSLNGDAGADAMASVIAHEIVEAVTDPQLNAWYDARGYENADKCAWRFGTTYKVANGSIANMKLGTMDYLIQQNWLNAAGGSCRLAY